MQRVVSFFIFVVLLAVFDHCQQKDKNTSATGLAEEPSSEPIPCAGISPSDSTLHYFDSLFSLAVRLEAVEISPLCQSPDSVNCNQFTVLEKYDSTSAGSSIDFSRIHNPRTLTWEANQLAQLFAGYVPSNDIVFCYNLRDGLAFYDSNEKIIQFIEICFECDQIRLLHDIPGVAEGLCQVQELKIAELTGKVN